MPLNPRGGGTSSMSKGRSLPRDRPSSASSMTQWLCTERVDHSTTMQLISDMALSRTARHVSPAGILRSHHTDQPSALQERDKFLSERAIPVVIANKDVGHSQNQSRRRSLKDPTEGLALSRCCAGEYSTPRGVRPYCWSGFFSELTEEPLQRVGLLESLVSGQQFLAFLPCKVRVSEVIGPLPQIAPKKLWAPSLWQGGMRRRGRPM